MKRPEHIVMDATFRCGKCTHTAHRRMVCPTCKAVVARCGEHDRDLQQQAMEHCR